MAVISPDRSELEKKYHFLANHAGDVSCDEEGVRDFFGEPCPLDGLSRFQLFFSQKLYLDSETSTSLFYKFANGKKNCFFLDSVENHETSGRYSLIGYDPISVYKFFNKRIEVSSFYGEKKQESEVDYDFRNFKDYVQSIVDNGVCFKDGEGELDKQILGKDKDTIARLSGLFGYLGWDSFASVENVALNSKGELDLPIAYLIRPSVMLVVDNWQHNVIIGVTARIESSSVLSEIYGEASQKIAEITDKLATSSSLDIPDKLFFDFLPDEKWDTVIGRSNTSKQEYLDIVEQVKEHIFAGDIFQAVPSFRISADFHGDPLTFYRILRETNPTPFLFYLVLDCFYVVGSSPEIMVKLCNGEINIRPLAGTRRRGVDSEEDAKLAEELLADKKELAEHSMLLDLGRNDVSHCAKRGSMRVKEAFTIEKYSQVMHISSHIVGDYAPEFSTMDVFLSGFPSGTVSGAPKIRAVEVLNEQEKDSREIYGGAIVYFDCLGSFDSAIALRTAVIKDEVVHIQAGAGVVKNSDPKSEFVECQNKAKALILAAELAMKRKIVVKY